MGFEFSILDFIQGIRTPALDTIMCFITKLGNAGILWILLGRSADRDTEDEKERRDRDGGACL